MVLVEALEQVEPAEIAARLVTLGRVVGAASLDTRQAAGILARADIVDTAGSPQRVVTVDYLDYRESLVQAGTLVQAEILALADPAATLGHLERLERAGRAVIQGSPGHLASQAGLACPDIPGRVHIQARAGLPHTRGRAGPAVRAALLEYLGLPVSRVLAGSPEPKGRPVGFGFTLTTRLGRH